MVMAEEAEDRPTHTDHLVSTGRTGSEEAIMVETVYPIVTEYLLVEMVTTAMVLVMEDLARTVEEMGMVEEMVSVVVNLPILMGHRRMDSVEMEVREREDRPAAMEHLVEEMDSLVEATGKMDSVAVVHRAATVLRKMEMVLMVEMEVRPASMDHQEETVETVEMVEMEDDHREAMVRLKETEEDLGDFMEHRAETGIMVVMVDILMED